MSATLHRLDNPKALADFLPLTWADMGGAPPNGADWSEFANAAGTDAKTGSFKLAWICPACTTTELPTDDALEPYVLRGWQPHQYGPNAYLLCPACAGKVVYERAKRAAGIHHMEQPDLITMNAQPTATKE